MTRSGVEANHKHREYEVGDDCKGCCEVRLALCNSEIRNLVLHNEYVDERTGEESYGVLPMHWHI